MSTTRELLTSAPDGDGVVHAFYASAERTLCNRPKPLRVKGWPARPTCETCVTTARAFHRIDGACPTNWHGLQVLVAASSTPPRVVHTVEGVPPEAIGLSDYTPDSVIAAIQRWADEHEGEPPKSTEWIKPLTGWPSTTTVIRLFGKWSQAIAAAGLDPAYHLRPRRATTAISPGGASRDCVALAVLAAGRAFVETLERELLEALESEAA